MVATQPINGFTGQCRLHITKTAIIVSLSNGEELATWLYNCIRQFNAFECCFSFTSGRRGPFGVGEYCFELPQKKLVEIQKKISGYTGAVFAHNHSYGESTLSASTNVSNPSKPKLPVTNDNARCRSESETAPSAPLSSNLYPLTNLPQSQTYHNTGIRRAFAPPVPSKDPPVRSTVALQNDVPDAKYVNAMKGAPKPLPRTMKPSLKKTDVTDGAKAPAYSSRNSTIAASSPYKNGSVTLPSHSESSQVTAVTKPITNPVGAYSDLNRDPPNYGDMVYSPNGPDRNHSSSSSSSPPPLINCGYADVDYDVIRRNREMGKFSDPDGTYSDAKDKKANETYNVPSSLQVAVDTYDVPRPNGGKFEHIPDVYEDDRKQPSPSDLYSVPTSNQPITSELYNVPPPRGHTVLQTYNVPSGQDQIYDNPSKPSLSRAAYDHGIRDSLYDTPQSNQPVVGGHETYDVVPSRKAYSSSPQPKGVTMHSYENIGPHGEILGEIVAEKLREDLLSSLNAGDHRWKPRPLKDVNSKFSRSCDFLNMIGQEPTTKRFSSSNTYRRLIVPDPKIPQGNTLSPRHTHKLHRRLSGSLDDVPTMVDSSDDGTYVVLNKTEKPNRNPLLSAPKPVTDVAAPSVNGVEDDGELNDTYVAMNRSPSHSSSGSSIINTETLPKGYIRMSTAKEALAINKSSSTIDSGRKETSPTNTEGKRGSGLVWPSNSGWSQWNPQDEQGSRKSSDTSEVFSPPLIAAVTDEHPIVVSKPSTRPKRSILLKGVSPQPVSGQEKRVGK